MFKPDGTDLSNQRLFDCVAGYILHFMRTRSISAFTLIELLIVVAIIGILAAIAVPNFLNAQMRAKVTRVEADFKQLSTALESYRIDNNNYPVAHLIDQKIASGTAATRFYALSTPVAYINFYPDDPFGSPQEAGTFHTETYDYYDWTSVQMNNLNPISTRGAYWRIASAGPDKIQNVGTVVDYDGSNGLISRGDIVRLGPQAVPFDESRLQ